MTRRSPATRAVRNLIVLGLTLAVPPRAFSQAQPLGRRIPYQGRVDGSGAVGTKTLPADLNVQVTLRTKNGRDVYGPESLLVKADAKGNFVFLIGSSEPPLDSLTWAAGATEPTGGKDETADLDQIPEAVLKDLRVHLSVEGKDLSPDQMLVPAYHAYSSDSAVRAGLADRIPAGATIDAGTVKSEAIAAGAVKSEAIGDSQVQESDLQNGAVSEGKLSTPFLAKVNGLQAAVSAAVTYVNYGNTSVPQGAWKNIVSMNTLPTGKYLVIGVGGADRCDFGYIPSTGTLRQQSMQQTVIGDFFVTNPPAAVALRCRFDCAGTFCPASLPVTGSLIAFKVADLKVNIP